MKTNQKGFAASTAIIIFLTVALLAAGAYIYMNQTAGSKLAPIAEKEDAQLEPADKTNTKTCENISETDKPLENKNLSGMDNLAGWQTYLNEKCGYEIKYPADYSPKEYYGNVSFITSDTIKCHEQGGPTETMCDEMNAGPYIDCALTADFLNGVPSLEEYISIGITNHEISSNPSPKPVSVGNLSGTEVEGSGIAGAYKDIYLQKGGYIIRFTVAKEGNAAGVQIYDQMLSTFKLIDK